MMQSPNGQRPEQLRRLRDVLVTLYPNADDAQRLAADAGLPPGKLTLKGKPVDFWHNILAEAEKHHKTNYLLDLVQTALRNGALPGSQEWQWEILRPGDDPLRTLALPLVTRLEPGLSHVDRLTEARKLADRLRDDLLPVGDVLAAVRERLAGAPRLLLIFDQFEETFTLCADETVRRAFLAALVAAAETPWLTVLLTVRADFFGHLLREARLGQRVDGGQVYVLPMTAAERRAAFCRRAGATPCERGGRRAGRVATVGICSDRVVDAADGGRSVDPCGLCRDWRGDRRYCPPR